MVPKSRIAPADSGAEMPKASVFIPSLVYLRNVGQGSSSLEGEACSTLAMSSQRRSGTAPR